MPTHLESGRPDPSESPCGRLVERIGAVPGATDGTAPARHAGLPPVADGPGGTWIAHRQDAYVRVRGSGAYARVHVAAARRLRTAPGARETR